MLKVMDGVAYKCKIQDSISKRGENMLSFTEMPVPVEIFKEKLMGKNDIEMVGIIVSNPQEAEVTGDVYYDFMIDIDGVDYIIPGHFVDSIERS